MQDFDRPKETSFIAGYRQEGVKFVKKAFHILLNLIGFGLFWSFFFLLVSYSPQDPSSDHVTDGSVHNWMGPFGALIANHLFQWIGWASFILPFGLFWRFFQKLKILPIVSPLGFLFLGVGLSLFQPPLRAYPNALAVLFFKFFPANSARMGFMVLAFLIWGWKKIKPITLLKTLLKRVFKDVFKKKKKPVRSRYILPEEVFEAPMPTRQKPARVRPQSQPVEETESQPEDTISSASLLPETLDYHTIKTEKSLPPLSLLIEAPLSRIQPRTLPLEPLQRVLQDFGVKGQLLKAHAGPVVSLYEFQPAAGVKSSRVISLADDIARSMSSLSARIAPIPGKNVLGIELSNPARETIFLRDLLNSPAYHQFQGSLPIALGKDISGAIVVVDLCKMPHVLVAGTTGSGKSVGLNTMILSLIYRLTPEQCRFIFIDPKRLELSIYNGIPHLLTPVVCEPAKAITTLKWVVQEMENRYRIMSQLGVRHIAGYHQHIKAKNPKVTCDMVRQVQVGFDKNHKPIVEDQKISLPAMPFIVVIVDEMSDLMVVAGKDVEVLVQRLAQMARAAGIHLIMATQRPSVDVVTGTIKANFPTRISFQVASKIDSRTILGEQGAEHLLGQGDMLYMASGGRLQRVHGAFVSDQEIDRVVAFLKQAHGSS